MSNKATIEIDADAGTVTVLLPEEDLRTLGMHQVDTSKAELVATILAMQSRELMAMSKQELMARHLVMLEK
jgi:hypothetical protein